MLELYQIENCPYCQIVRNKLTQLGLSYIVHNRTNPETQEKLMELGGKTQVPMLVDPNHNLVLYESEDILKHLEKHYSS